MPLPSSDMLLQFRNHLIRKQINYDISTKIENLNMMLPTLNFEQMDIFHSIVNADDSNNKGCIFMYESGNAGKTYIWQAIIAMLRSKGKIILSVASPGSNITTAIWQNRSFHVQDPFNLTEATYCLF